MKKYINPILKILGIKISRIQADPQDHAFRQQQKIIEIAAQKSNIIFDIGANYGQTCLKYLKYFPNCKIHAFEPFPNSFSKLKEIMGARTGHRLNEVALSDSCGQEIFYVNHDPGTNSLFQRPLHGKRYYPEHASAKCETEVPVMTLDSYCEKINIKNIDIVKLDIQGGELKVLNGAEKLLKKKSILLIYTEVWYYPNYEKAPLMNQLWSYLSLFDYTLFNIYNNINASDGQLSQGDAIFISPEIRERFNSL